MAEEDEFYLDLTLAHQINPEKCAVKIYGSKVGMGELLNLPLCQHSACGLPQCRIVLTVHNGLGGASNEKN